MRSIASVFTALANLAASINALATTLIAADAQLREQLTHEPPVPQITHGEVIDNSHDPARNGTSRRTSKVK